MGGLKLRELVAQYLERGLSQPPDADLPTRQRSPIPVIPRAATGQPIPALSRAAIARLEADDDLAKHARSLGC